MITLERLDWFEWKFVFCRSPWGSLCAKNKKSEKWSEVGQMNIWKSEQIDFCFPSSSTWNFHWKFKIRFIQSIELDETNNFHNVSFFIVREDIPTFKLKSKIELFDFYFWFKLCFYLFLLLNKFSIHINSRV